MILQRKLLKDARFEDNKEYSVLFETPLVSGYEDVTSSISDWHSLGRKAGKDYKFIREKIKSLSADFNSLSDADKYTTSSYMLPDPFISASNGHLGADFPRYLSEWVSEGKSCREKRWEHAKLRAFMLIVEAKEVLNTVLFDNLHDKYIEGLESFAEDGVTGLFDYVEGSGDYSGGGLQNSSFTPINQGDTMGDVVISLMDILRNGNY